MSPHEDTVLVIEDEDEARNFLIQILELEGFVAKGFSNGAEALEFLRHSELPCLIVLDVRMPVMDGPRFRAAMVADPRLATVPLVVVTAFDPSVGAGLSALRVFTKPVDVNALVELIRRNC